MQTCKACTVTIPRLEGVHHVVHSTPQPVPSNTPARVPMCDPPHDEFHALASTAAVFVGRPQTASHVDCVFSRIGHIRKPDPLDMVDGICVCLIPTFPKCFEACSAASHGASI